MSNHIIMSRHQGASSMTRAAAPEFSDLDVPGWQGLSLQDSGVFMFLFNISPGANEFPVHASEDEWLAYVICGSGTLYSGTGEMQRTDGMEYTAGDFITFAANTPHGWKNGDESSRILFAKRA